MSRTAQVPRRAGSPSPSLLAAVVAGCGSKAEESAAPAAGESGSLKTGPGVTDTRSRLGLLTDLTGVFAALGKPIVQGTQLFWEQQNAAGGVCDRTVELDVKDHGYDPQKAVVQYRELSRRGRAAAAARLADDRGAAADAQDRLDALAARGVAVRRCSARTSSASSARPTTSRSTTASTS